MGFWLRGARTFPPSKFDFSKISFEISVEDLKHHKPNHLEIVSKLDKTALENTKFGECATIGK